MTVEKVTYLSTRERKGKNNPGIEVSLPTWNNGKTIITPEEKGFGNWVGAPSAVGLEDESVVMAYRIREPDKRGSSVKVVASADGITFNKVPLVEITSGSMGAESLERPALVRAKTQEGKDVWRLYLSRATHGTKHWDIVMLEAETLPDLKESEPQMILPGDRKLFAIKDPVIRQTADGIWHMIATRHPVTDDQVIDAQKSDVMATEYLTSRDGLTWDSQGTVLAPGQTGEWDARGRRGTAMTFKDNQLVGLAYDGRDSAERNFEEQTNSATLGKDGEFHVNEHGPASVSPFWKGGLRYLEVVDLPDGDQLLYYEAPISDTGEHGIRVERKSAYQDTVAKAA